MPAGPGSLRRESRAPGRASAGADVRRQRPAPRRRGPARHERRRRLGPSARSAARRACAATSWRASCRSTPPARTTAWSSTPTERSTLPRTEALRAEPPRARADVPPQATTSARWWKRGADERASLAYSDGGTVQSRHVAGPSTFRDLWRLLMTDRRSWLLLFLARHPGDRWPRSRRRAGGRADALRVRQREPVRHDGPARRVRRRARGGSAQPLRRPLPLARQPADARAVAGREPHRLRPTGSPTRSSCAAAPSSTTAPRSPPRTCATAPSASSPSRRARPSLLATMVAPGSTKAVDRSHRLSSRSPSRRRSSWPWCPRSTWSTRRSSRRTRRTATGARRGSPATTPAPAPTSSRATTPPSASSPSASPATSCRGGRSTSTRSSSGTVKEDNTRVLGMIKGDYQGTGGYLPNDQVKRLREAPNVKIVEQESMRIMMFQINNQRRAAQRRATCAAPSATRSTTTASTRTSSAAPSSATRCRSRTTSGACRAT